MVEKPKRTDSRGQWTIKHAGVGPEFQNAVRMAAERQGMTVGAFVVETLRERATAILKGEEGGTPHGTPPARLEDVLTEAVAELDRKQDERIGELARRQADELALLRRETRRGRWRR